jgi:hydrogenase nickel incorporation protein HypA/HybF
MMPPALRAVPMHELAICQGLIRQVERVAAENEAKAVARILLHVGKLSGVEPPLLERAFEIAQAGTVASEAELEIQEGPVKVQCRECGAGGEVPLNRLVCPSCGDWRVRVTEGEELLLLSLELEMQETTMPRDLTRQVAVEGDR